MNSRVILLLLFGFWGNAKSSEQAQEKPLPKINEAIVQEAHLCEEIEGLGTTQANEAVDITANVTEKVTAIFFEDGQKVKQGDPLIYLDKEEEGAELKALEALLLEKEPSYERAKDLTKRRALPEATLESRKASLKELEGNIQVVKTKIKDRVITAPFSGVTGFRGVSPGTLVKPGDKITTLYDVSKMKLDFEVPSLFLKALKVGLPVFATIEAYPDKIFKGIIRAVNPSVDPVTRTVSIRALLDNEEGFLKPGLFMKARLAARQYQGIIVPEEAILQTGQDHFIFILEEEGKTFAKRVKVIPGLRKGGFVEIRQGLSVGQKIVARGNLNPEERQEVQVSPSVVPLREAPASLGCEGI